MKQLEILRDYIVINHRLSHFVSWLRQVFYWRGVLLHTKWEWRNFLSPISTIIVRIQLLGAKDNARRLVLYPPIWPGTKSPSPKWYRGRNECKWQIKSQSVLFYLLRIKLSGPMNFFLQSTWSIFRFRKIVEHWLWKMAKILFAKTLKAFQQRCGENPKFDPTHGISYYYKNSF